MKESIIQTMVNKFLTWLSKKSVTALYKQTHFWVFSWGLDEHTDLYLFSEESYHGRHRFGLHEETYDHKGEPTQDQHVQHVGSVESVEAEQTEPQTDCAWK